MLSKRFFMNYLKSDNDFDILTCSQLRYFLNSKGFGCLAKSNYRKSVLLENAKYIFNKYCIPSCDNLYIPDEEFEKRGIPVD